MNVIFISSGSGGDVLPFLRIGRRLKARGQDVALISHCYYGEMARRSGIDFAALDSPEEYAAFIEDGLLLNTPRGTLESIRRHSLPKVLREVGLIQQRYRRGETVLVARDLFDLACRIASEKLGIPALWAFMAPIQIAAGRLRLQLFRDILAPDINRLRSEVALPPVNDWVYWLRYAERSIALWPDWFAAPEDSWPAGVVPVGFPTDDDFLPNDLFGTAKEILNGEKAPILITSGTGMYFASEFYAASAAACRLLDLPAILVTPHEKLLPPRLPDNVKWFKELPFSKLMPHVSAVIHHGGIGTIASALTAGIPQLVLAVGADRPDNAFRLRQLGVAEVEPPPRWRADLIAAALKRLLHSSVVRDRCNELASRLRACDGAAAACELIEGTLHRYTQGTPPGIQ